jgi:flagellin
MPQVINSNILSLNAQRNLSRSSSELTTTIQRLSSGLRINGAKDDAAGLAIATRMTTQIQGLSVAVRNTNDGISIAQTAEGALDEIVKSLVRANDLSLQAASYNTDTDRKSIDQEVQQLKEEFDRITNQTRFNGQKLLSGGFTANIQVGTTVNETLNVTIGNLSSTNLGAASNYSAVNALSTANLADRARNQQDGTITAGTSTINGVALATSFAAGAKSDDKIAAINAISANSGVTAFSFGNALVATTDVLDANASGAGGLTIGTAALTLNGISIDGNGANTTMTDLAANINAKSAETGVTATVEAGGAANQSRLVLTNTTGNAISLTVNDANAATATGFASGNNAVGAGENGVIVLTQDINETTVTFDSAGTGGALTGVSGATSTLTNESVANQKVTSASSANLALLTFQKAVDQINSERSVLGAKLNRFDSVIRNLENVRENVSAARSRIQDADFAVETANLTRTQILQQAGTAMVSQANSLPQSALSLLQ